MAAKAGGEGTDFQALFGHFVLGSFLFVLVAAAGLTFIVGFPYFNASDELQEAHALHSMLRPGGFGGLILGFVGTGLMLVMLLYSVRKWIPFASFLGTPAWWLRFHIICGVMGPVFICLHAALALPGGIVGIGFWCMILVALSGVFGRYLFGHFPTTAAGRRTDLAFARASLTELRARLVAETQDADLAQVGRAVKLARSLNYEPRGLMGLMVLDAEVRRRADLVQVLLKRVGLSGSVEKRATKTLVAQLHMKKSLAAWEVARKFFRFWHLFHQPLAMAMYMIAALHILQALLFGGVFETLFGL